MLSREYQERDSLFHVYDSLINKNISDGNINEATSISNYALKQAEHYYGVKNHTVAYFLTYLSICYASNGNIQEAINYSKRAVEMYEGIDVISNESYIQALILLTNYYNENKQYADGITILKRSLQHINTLEISSDKLSILYRALANSYSSLSNYPAAQYYMKKASELYKDKQSSNYWGLKTGLAWLYSKNHDDEDACQTICEVCDTIKAKQDMFMYAKILQEKSSIYLACEDYKKNEEAIQYAIESAHIYEIAGDTLSEDYVNSLMELARAYSKNSMSNKSLEIYKKVYILQKEFLNTTNKDDLEILAYSAVLAQNLQDGLLYFQMLKKFVLKESGEYSLDYAYIEYRLFELYSLLRQYDSALENIVDALPIIRNSLTKVFFKLNDKERSTFWNKFIDVFNNTLPRICYNSLNPLFNGLMYDSSLLSKGILLNTERIKRNITQKEASVDDFVRPFFLKWQDVQTNLANNDIAIEFVRITPTTDIPIYVAVTLRHQYEMPRIIPLFIEENLEQVSDTLYYQCPEMYNLVWKPLQEELQGVKNIYFSPSGRLHNIGIEYLPEMESFNIYRLSSTRELVTKESQETEKKAVLYGGLDYAAMIDSASVVISVAKIEEKFKERANVRGMGLRGGKEYLEHTKIEVDDIGRELNEAQWVCLLDTASLGTEESFKSLSGKRVGCMHISTHGFYYTQQAAVNTGYNFLLLNDKMASEEDKALTRTGLIMSGANHILDGDTIPDNVEDGILTAKEIADVDLRGLDLVVLSACQTGLGDISQGEGVFGLQRGFKKAGAKSILMSLWEVDDKATQILMTQFYKNLLSGQSKRLSLLSAQKYLRDFNGGIYDKPQYWAAFILLDAK